MKKPYFISNDFIKKDNYKFNVENLAKLTTCKSLILHLLEKCLKCLKSNFSLDFANNELKIYLENISERSNMLKCCVEHHKTYNITKHNLKLKKTIFWFVNFLNLPRVFIFQRLTTLLILFDTINEIGEVNGIYSLYESIKIIEIDVKPKFLSLINVIKNEHDLNILSKLITVEELEIRNDVYTELKISNFILPRLLSIILINVNISIRGLCYLTASKNLSALHLYGSHLLNKNERDIKYLLDSNIKELTIRNCYVDSLFFDWYDQVKNIKSLSFDNNISKDLNVFDDNKDVLLEKLIGYKKCCFSEMQIKILIKKKSLESIIIRCSKHKYDFGYANFGSNNACTTVYHSVCDVYNTNNN